LGAQLSTEAPRALALRSRRVVLADRVIDGTVVVENGRISEVLTKGWVPAGVELEDFGDLALLPGAVDVHVHINEPGRTSWEGFASATHAAAAGGITTLVDMPLNSSPVTTTTSSFLTKLNSIRSQLAVDVAFHGGLIPNHLEQLGPLADAGVVAFKAFMIDSGIDEFPAVSARDLAAALPIIARLDRPLLAHAELAPTGPPPADRRSYRGWLDSRPESCELAAVELLLRLLAVAAEKPRIHIVHVASAAVCERLRRAPAGVSAETCPHYLTFAAEEIADGDPLFKCAPPIREAEHREALWRALGDGTLALVASDHSPAPPALKQLVSGDLWSAWGGISSLQLLVPALWTGARARGFGLLELATWLCRAPADLIGFGKKGRIEAGAAADLMVLAPEKDFKVEARELYHRHSPTPYLGRQLFGKVERTYLRGELAYDSARGLVERRGTALLRKERKREQSEP
jgi:allantoinase